MVDYKGSQKVWLGKVVMDITQIKERLAEIGERLVEINQQQASAGLELARAQGTDEIKGISIDPLTKWAWEMRNLNTEVAELVSERKALKEVKRGLRTCECDCH
jgi:hypothetical protein